MSGKKEPKKKLCFVISPIGGEESDERAHADWVLEEIIEPVLAEYPDFEVRRADQMETPGLIDSQIIGALLEAELVIADLSVVNANVFYEIGIRHMAQKPIVHMHKVGVELPFDVKLFRSLPFSLGRPRDLAAARKKLEAFVRNALSPDVPPENPVTKARGALELKQSATPPERLLLDAIEGFSRRLSSLERNAALGLTSFQPVSGASAGPLVNATQSPRSFVPAGAFFGGSDAPFVGSMKVEIRGMDTDKTALVAEELVRAFPGEVAEFEYDGHRMDFRMDGPPNHARISAISRLVKKHSDEAKIRYRAT